MSDTATEKRKKAADKWRKVIDQLGAEMMAMDDDQAAHASLALEIAKIGIINEIRHYSAREKKKRQKGKA